MEQVRPFGCSLTYSPQIPNSRHQFNTTNPDALFDEGKVVSWINQLRLKFHCIDRCIMIFGVIIFVIFATISFIFMLPLMAWIIIGWFGMLFAGVGVLCLRKNCPSRIYNVLIDVFQIPHQKYTQNTTHSNIEK
mmetsp:Transcript_14320/g.21630  ORF Transcript_14320/g.21630 Transcript_14320/m.21630 type:complete len:134 (+) Transcript_14320:31-432(+)